MNSAYCRLCLILALVSASWPAIPGWSQIVPDSSVNTVVTPTGTTLQIDGGTTAGTNLFHSFQDFSVPTGTEAFFNNPLAIENIITRVTGSKISNIDGIIRANGTANLFLINPKGLIFGPNASLNIGGSFIGSTAESVVFADGMKFSATNPNNTPLLTVSVPIGLQLAADAGPIQVAGSGNLQTFRPTASPPDSNQSVSGLQVPENQTLALSGSEINLIGATLKAPDGRVELWAAQNAQLTINNPAGWQLASPAATANWGTILLRQTALVDAGGINGGAINVRGRGLTLLDASNIRSSTSSGQGKGITLQMTEFIELLGISALGQPYNPGISTSVGQPFGLSFLSSQPGPPTTGQAGDIFVETKRLELRRGSWIQSTTQGNNSRTGDVTVKAPEINIVGPNPFRLGSSAITNLIANGNNNEAGNLTIEAQRISLINNGRISSDVLRGSGTAGNISIRATESLEIRGVGETGGNSGVLSSLQAGTTGQGGQISIETGRLILAEGGIISSGLSGNRAFIDILLPGAKGTAGNIEIRAGTVEVSEPVIDEFSGLMSGITVSAGEGATGSGGSITLQADRLRVFNGGQITSSNLGQGQAGNVNLQVNNIDVEGISQPLPDGRQLPSSITAASTTSANAGSVTLTANQLNIRNGGEITVSNTGGGNAGNLQVNTNRLQLDRGGSLRAEVTAGTQGNINLNVNDLLLMRNGSQINTNATGSATGGNITINAPVMAGLENSDIAANAIQGAGGNIQISTQGIFGLEFREQPTDQSDITASSEFGVSGNVRITNPDVQPNAALVELPANLIDPNQKVAQGCDAAQNNRFIATGRGGLPPNPTQRLEAEEHPWTDVRDLSAFRRQTRTTASAPKTSQPGLVEANGWKFNEQGQVEIYVSEAIAPNFLQPTCAGSALSAL